MSLEPLDVETLDSIVAGDAWPSSDETRAMARELAAARSSVDRLETDLAAAELDLQGARRTIAMQKEMLGDRAEMAQRDIEERDVKIAALVSSIDRIRAEAQNARSRHMSSTDPTECFECDHDQRVSVGAQGPLCREARSLDAILAECAVGGGSPQ